MELRHLRYFVAVAEEQNVSRAAMRLHVSQPALSRQIRDLEDELHVTLFSRTAKSIHLTEAGRIFLNEAQAVLLRADEAVKNLRAAVNGQEEALQIGYAPSPTSDFLPGVLRSFRKAAPEVRVTLHDMTSSEMLAGLRTGELHAALLVGHRSNQLRGLKFERLRSYRVGIVVPPDHPLAQKRSIQPSEFLTEPLVAYNRKEFADYHEWLNQVLGFNARKLRVVEECDGALSMIAAVESGRGIAVSAESLALFAGARLHFIPIKPAPAAFDVGICYPHLDRAPVALRLFVDKVREIAQVQP